MVFVIIVGTCSDIRFGYIIFNVRPSGVGTTSKLSDIMFDRHSNARKMTTHVPDTIQLLDKIFTGFSVTDENVCFYCSRCTIQFKW